MEMEHIRINRNQLGAFMPDHRALRQFELLFRNVNELASMSDDLEKLSIFNDTIETYIPENDEQYLTRQYHTDEDALVSGQNGTIVVMSGLTTNRTVTLPPADIEGQRIGIIDIDGSCLGTRQINISPDGTDTINKEAYATFGFPYFNIILVSDGVGGWVIEYCNYIPLSAGVIVQPSYEDLGTGSVAIGDGVYALFSNPDGSGRICQHALTGDTFILTDNSNNYIVADYDGGVPSVKAITNVLLINETTVVPVYTIYRSGIELHLLDWDTLGLAMTNKTHQSIVKTDRFRQEPPGMTLGETDTPDPRTILVGDGNIWYGAAKQICEAVDSSSDSAQQYNHVAGVWTKTDITQYDNTYYDDGTDLVELTNNRYCVNFVYRCVSSIEKHIFTVLGRGDYKIDEAIDSQPPSDLPPEVSASSVLVGRIIVQKGKDIAYSIESAYGNVFNPGPNINPQPSNSITKEITGFAYPDLVSISYDSTTRKVTLTGDPTAYWQGIIVPELIDGWVSDAHDNVNGVYLLYYDGESFKFTTPPTPWPFWELLVCFVNFGASDKFCVRECHGFMENHVHKELHETIGTYFISGGGLSGFTLASTTANDRRPAVAATVIADEDCPTTVNALADNGPYTQMYLTGTSTNTFVTAASDIVPLSVNRPYWNSFSGTFGQTLMSNNSYMSIWLVATPVTTDSGSQAYRYLWIQGQSNGTLASEQAVTFQSLNLGNLSSQFNEFVPIAKLIINYSGVNWTLHSVEYVRGTRASSISVPSGTWLTAVTHDSTLSGLGTGPSPLLVEGNQVTTFGSLPVATTQQGMRRIITDSSVTTFLAAAAGGGANIVPVFSDGTNWLVG